MIEPEIVKHYEDSVEADRLGHGTGVLELYRTQELLRRHLPPAPARILDVGGGPGVHAAWLRADGYDVRLLDPVGTHVEQAQAQGIDADLGDARQLDEPDASYDAVLLLGPLYHLVERAARVAALTEAWRVLRPGGLIAAAAINRSASLVDGIASGYLDDAEFAAIVESDLSTGEHHNPEGRPGWFTTAFFHHPDQLRAEMAEAGLDRIIVYGVEGPGGPFAVDRRLDDAERERLLWAARLIETEPTMLGWSFHLLAVGWRH
jgi:SAM-dependent methyltransferase